MDQPEKSRQNDSLLLSTENGEEAKVLLGALIIERAEPIVRAIIGYKLRVFVGQSGHSRHNQDSDDVYGEVVIKLLRRLRNFKTDPDEYVIGSFRHYVKAAAANACAEYL